MATSARWHRRYQAFLTSCSLHFRAIEFLSRYWGQRFVHVQGNPDNSHTSFLGPD